MISLTETKKASSIGIEKAYAKKVGIQKKTK